MVSNERRWDHSLTSPTDIGSSRPRLASLPCFSLHHAFDLSVSCRLQPSPHVQRLIQDPQAMRSFLSLLCPCERLVGLICILSFEPGRLRASSNIERKMCTGSPQAQPSGLLSLGVDAVSKYSDRVKASEYISWLTSRR